MRRERCAMAAVWSRQRPRLHCPGRSRWAARAPRANSVLRGARAMSSSLALAAPPHGGARGPHAARVRWHVALPAACLRTCDASMQRQAHAGRGACRLQCVRHVRLASRSGWCSEPRVRVARAQVADSSSRAHGPPGRLEPLIIRRHQTWL